VEAFEKVEDHTKTSVLLPSLLHIVSIRHLKYRIIKNLWGIMLSVSTPDINSLSMIGPLCTAVRFQLYVIVRANHLQVNHQNLHSMCLYFHLSSYFPGLVLVHLLVVVWWWWGL